MIITLLIHIRGIISTLFLDWTVTFGTVTCTFGPLRKRTVPTRCNSVKYPEQFRYIRT